MAKSGDLIKRNNFTNACLATWEGDTNHNGTYYIYLCAVSFEVRYEVQPKILDDAHCDVYNDYWDGSKWVNFGHVYMQDTNARKYYWFAHNRDNISQWDDRADINSSDLHLWRLRTTRDKWKGPLTTYIGIYGLGKLSDNEYNNVLKVTGDYIKSNGGAARTGVSRYCWVTGLTPKSDDEVIQYFSTNKGTRIYAEHDGILIPSKNMTTSRS